MEGAEMPINPETGFEFDATGLPWYTYGGQFVDQEYDLPMAVDPTGTPSWDFQFSGIGQLLKGLGLDTSSGSVLKSLGSLFTGKSEHGELGQLLGFGGAAALVNKLLTQKPDPVGYQGGIPQYTVTRTQTPMEQQRPANYRPGQGGITYFAPTQYNYTGKDLAAPTLASPSTGGITGGTTGGSNAGVNTSGSVATPGYTGPVTVDGIPLALYDPAPKNFGPTGPMPEGAGAAAGGYMPGGIAMLAGGRYLRGPGDGVSDSIPAKFERSGQPARLADGEFVIDARTVSEIGNGSSEAGARKLYAMMDRVHKARKTAQRGKPSGADKYLPK